MYKTENIRVTTEQFSEQKVSKYLSAQNKNKTIQLIVGLFKTSDAVRATVRCSEKENEQECTEVGTFLQRE